MSAAAPSNIDVDFLPNQFREEDAQRRARALQIIVVGVFITLIAAGWLVQQHSLRGLRNELAAMSPLQERAQALNKQLSDLQSTLASANSHGELVTYLRHPWPRTQILAAVLVPLPNAITVSELRLVAELPEIAAPAFAGDGDAPKAETKKVEKLEPPQRDLKALRTRNDGRTLVVALLGTTQDVTALHAYLAEVAEHDLVAKVELKSLEQGLDAAEASRFQARLVIRGGYGQKGGPDVPRDVQAKIPLAASDAPQPRSTP